MTHYLRRNGNTIVDVEATKDDISSVVCLGEFAGLLWDDARPEVVIFDFEALQELRAEYHETNYQKETPDELAKRRLQEIAVKYNLSYVTD